MKGKIILTLLALCVFIACTPSEKKEVSTDVSRVSEKKEVTVDISFFDTIISEDVDVNAKAFIWKEPEKIAGVRIYGDKLLKDNGDYRFSECNLEYKGNLILLLLEKIEGKEAIVDYVCLKKTTDTSYFTSGPVEINGEYYDWDIVVFVNQSWRAEYTEDILCAFKSNLEKKKIEPVIYKNIRLYSEV